MDIAEIIAKAAEGQTLTDEERAALKDWKAPDTKALEDANAELRAKLALATGAKDKGAAEMETLRRQVADLTKAVETERAERKRASDEAAAIRRAQTIEGLRAKHGIAFIDGVDPALTRQAFEHAFRDVQDLGDEAKVRDAVEAFRKSNAGLIRAASGGPGIPFGGGGGGDHARDASGSTEAMAQRLAKAGIIKGAQGR